MASATKTTFSSALKQAIPAKRIEYVGYKDNPLLALIKKNSNWVGDVMRFVVWYGGNQGGVSASFSEAQANKSVGLHESFNLTTVKKYGLTSIETEVILASKSDPGAFLRAAKSEVERTIANVSNDIGMGLYRNSGGARGRVGSTNTTTLTLKNLEDVVHFAKDMVIVSSATDGTSGSADTTEVTIAGVDLDAGTLTRSGANWTAEGDFSDDDYLFRAGDFGACISGLDSWLPESAPGATAFFGVDRTSNVTRLGGVRIDGSGQNLEEALLEASTRLGREGASPDVCMMNYDDVNELRKEMGHRIQYGNVTAQGLVPLSFKSIEIPGPNSKPIKVMADRNCPQGVAYMLQLDSWCFASHGQAPHMLTANVMGGSQDSVIWEGSADAVEIRTGFYGNLGCWAPGYNARIKLATAA